jgi:hypothetical protein
MKRDNKSMSYQPEDRLHRRTTTPNCNMSIPTVYYTIASYSDPVVLRHISQ